MMSEPGALEGRDYAAALCVVLSYPLIEVPSIVKLSTINAIRSPKSCA